MLQRGGMGAVYLAWDAKLKRDVAIKLLGRDLLLVEDCVRRFEREAKILADLNHPNIATVHKAGRCDGRPFYVMEYIDGPSLADVLADRGKLAGSKCIHYLSMAANGLKAAAESNIIHRDIKPANIMLNSAGELKIVDFGNFESLWRGYAANQDGYDYGNAALYVSGAGARLEGGFAFGYLFAGSGLFITLLRVRHLLKRITR